MKPEEFVVMNRSSPETVRSPARVVLTPEKVMAVPPEPAMSLPETVRSPARATVPVKEAEEEMVWPLMVPEVTAPAWVTEKLAEVIRLSQPVPSRKAVSLTVPSAPVRLPTLMP